jgi:hypothetical protein
LNYYKVDFLQRWEFSDDFSAAAKAYARELEQALLANLANGTLSTGNTTSTIRSSGEFLHSRLVLLA